MSSKKDIEKRFKDAKIPPDSKFQKNALALTPTEVEKAIAAMNKHKVDDFKYFETIFSDQQPLNQGPIRDDFRLQSRGDFRTDVGKWWDGVERKIQQQWDYIYPGLEIPTKLASK